MSHFRRLQVMLVLVLALASASAARLGTPLLASPYATSREERSKVAHPLLATSTAASSMPTDATATGITVRVSVASDGTQGNGSSYASSISADGRYVAFRSNASNLVASDTNQKYDIFVKDLGIEWK